MRKVEALAESVREVAVRTTVKTMHCNAITHWGDVVAEAEKCTALFQGADYGAWMDYAMMALAKSLRIPFVTASTYSMQFQCDVFHGAPTQPCWACNNFLEPSMSVPRLLEQKEEQLANSSTGGGAAQPAEPVAPTVSESEILEELRRVNRMDHPSMPGLVRECLRDVGVSVGKPLDGYTRPASKTPATSSSTEPSGAAASSGAAQSAEPTAGLGKKQLYAFLGALEQRTKELLVPSLIRSYDSLAFIPKDVATGTMDVGSWVGVCAIGSLMSVNIWVNMVMQGEAGVVNWTSGGLRVGQTEYFKGLQRWDIAKSVVDPVVGCMVCKDARRMFGCETLEESETKRREKQKKEREEKERKEKEEEEKKAKKAGGKDESPASSQWASPGLLQGVVIGGACLALGFAAARWSAASRAGAGRS